jgi:hypothetical protein
MFHGMHSESALARHLENSNLALTLPLEDLTEVGLQVRVTPGEIENWPASEGARRSLEKWGLPRIEEFGFMPKFQESSVPTVSADGRRYYSLGIYSRWEMCYLCDTGEVHGFPLAEWPETFFNSTLEAYIETSWRWFRVWREIKDMDWYIEKYDILNQFLEFAIECDPRVGSEQRSMWRGLIKSWI